MLTNASPTVFSKEVDQQEIFNLQQLLAVYVKISYQNNKWLFYVWFISSLLIKIPLLEENLHTK